MPVLATSNCSTAVQARLSNSCVLLHVDPASRLHSSWRSVEGHEGMLYNHSSSVLALAYHRKGMFRHINCLQECTSFLQADVMMYK